MNLNTVTSTQFWTYLLKFISFQKLINILPRYVAEVLCCKWDGCNSDVNSARLSKVEYEQYLLQQILGSEYDHFVSSDHNNPYKEQGEPTKEKLLNQANSPPTQLDKQSFIPNRRIGTFYSGSKLNQNKAENQQSANKGSNLFLDGFPDYFKPKLQVYNNSLVST